MNKTAKVFLPIAAICVLFAVILGIVAYNYQGNEQLAGEGTGQGEEQTTDTKEIPAFMNKCISCHGNDLTGGFGPNLRTIDLSKEEIVDVLKNGMGQMPKGLIPGKEEQAADYLLSIREGE